MKRDDSEALNLAIRKMIGKLIKSYVADSGITSREFVSLLGLSSGSHNLYFDYIKGHRDITIGKLLSLLCKLNVEPMEFFQSVTLDRILEAQLDEQERQAERLRPDIR